MTGCAFSILEHSADISWPPPAQPLVAEAELVAAGAAPDGPSGALAAVAAGPVAAVVRRDVAVRPVAFEASARPAARVLEVPQPAWVATVAAEPRLAFAPFPERAAWLPGFEPNRQPSVGPPEMPAHWPAADLAGRASRWGLAQLQRAPSRLGVQEVSPSRPGPARHWPSARLVPEAAHWGKRLRATAYLAQLSDRVACRECPVGLPD